MNIERGINHRLVRAHQQTVFIVRTSPFKACLLSKRLINRGLLLLLLFILARVGGDHVSSGAEGEGVSMSGLPSAGGGHGARLHLVLPVDDWNVVSEFPAPAAGGTGTNKRKRRPAGTPGTLDRPFCREHSDRGAIKAIEIDTPQGCSDVGRILSVSRRLLL